MSIWTDPRKYLASKRIWLWVTAGICGVLIFFLASIYGFLAVSNPVGEGVLVVEAWIPAKTLAESVKVFNSGRYSYLIVVGGPIQGSGSASNHPTTYADLAASKFEELGFDAKKLVKIDVPAVSFGRTLAGETEVRRWLDRSGTSVCCVDVFTVGVHARKSWIFSRHALSDRYRVGIIAGPEASFDPRFWLVSKRGIRIVVRNMGGYVYSKLWDLFNG
jgi:hypothetical protein